MCQNVPGAPDLSRDTGWHVTLLRDLCCPIRGQYSGRVTCVVQSEASIQGWQVPLSRVLWGHVATIRSYCPAPASSGQTEYFMRAETEERQGWFNGRRCFNKIIELYWSTTPGRNDQLDSLLAMFKGIVIKMKLSFVPTWAHHVFVDFCRLSTEPKSVNFMLWWENSYRFLYLYFSLLR